MLLLLTSPRARFARGKRPGYVRNDDASAYGRPHTRTRVTGPPSLKIHARIFCVASPPPPRRARASALPPAA